MTQGGGRPEDDVSIVRRGRIEIDFEGGGAPASSAAEPGPPSAADRQSPPAEDPDIVLRTPALLFNGERLPIPRGGLTIGSGPEAVVALPPEQAAPVEAVVEPTPDGYVLVARGESGRTFLNGERLVHGERRPLDRGDAVGVGDTILYYLPASTPERRLAPVSPVDVGRVRADKAVFTIGRDESCDLVLDHPTVARRHAVIRFEGGRGTIEDCGTASGVVVGGRRVRRSPLAAGDEIAIGAYRIVYDGHEIVERAPAAGLAVAAHRVQVQVGDQTILQPTDLDLRPGELVAMIGESGAGKSTLLNVLAGVSAPTGGGVLVGGEEIAARVSEMGYVPQFDIVHGALTVREALDFAARLRLPVDTTVEERMTRIDEVLEQLGLTERADLRVANLSGGQRKRAAVAIELLHQPGALFLDEPTTGLDPGFERKLMELFKRLAHDGQTVALVTHATASLNLCDRVLVMGRGGVLVFDGTPAELLESFGVDDFDEIYEKLAEGQAPQVARPEQVPVEGRARGRRPLPPISGKTGPRPIEQPLGYQARVLAARYATLLTRDRRAVRGALIQVPILGLLTGLLFSGDVFDRPPADGAAGKAAQLVFLMITIAIWLGSINGAREIVKERNVITRELAIGVRVPAYLAAKLIVLLTMTAAQVVLFSLIVLTFRSPGESQSTSLMLVAVLVISSWVAVLFGLLVSAYASSEDHATGIIPLLLVPQLLLGGAIVPLEDMGGAMRLITNLVPARWGFAAAGEIMHMNERIAEDQQFSQVSHYGHDFFALSTPAFFVISAIFAVGLFTVLGRMLSNSAITSMERPPGLATVLWRELVNPRAAQ